MKHDILQKRAEMYKYSAYPQDEHFNEEAFISKHPCLAEPGSSTGCQGWKNSLKFKMGNLRSKLHRCGVADVSVNSNKRTQQKPDGEPPSKNIKKPWRSETNFLPNFSQGQDASAMENSRQLLENEMKKRTPNTALDSDAVTDIAQIPVGILTVVPEDSNQVQMPCTLSHPALASYWKLASLWITLKAMLKLFA
ncbi:hypothetical protein MHYP_G00063490 [Metynnis hypsauchen]